MATVTPVSWKACDDELLAELKAQAKELKLGWSAFVVQKLREAHEGAVAKEDRQAAILAELREIKQMLQSGAHVQVVQGGDLGVAMRNDNDITKKALGQLGL